MINISLQPEYILGIGGIYFSNTFLTSFVVSLILIVFSFIFYRNRNRKILPLSILKITIYELMRLTDRVTGDRKMTKTILPVICTFFIYIVTANLIALLPGFLGSFYIYSGGQKIALLRSPNSDVNTTFALAIFSVLATQYFSFQRLGTKKYISRFLNIASPLSLLLGFFEILSEAAKVLSFSFRLFGNIFAGEILLLVIAFLVPYIIPIPFMFMEIFVGIIQAFIFAVLTLTFIKTSTITTEI
ncbi:F0F1 ATP synthase subunit A [Patescibacteria group bacterium]|nr:F0F1 ATP synthase subunit A [Patescibacteria group bacterium]MCL5797849.1 F0F1 ATP synthase subunit A [Patescibacteria group bacterium]